MGETLRLRLGQSNFASDHHEALLGLMMAATTVIDAVDAVCQKHGVTRAQYNVLRILRGAPEGHARCEIASRLIERAPDVTRMIDRLLQQGMIERRASDKDRRLSIAKITRKGLNLLDRMQPEVDEVTARLSSKLSSAEASELLRLCERLIEGAEPAGD